MYTYVVSLLLAKRFSGSTSQKLISGFVDAKSVDSSIDIAYDVERLYQELRYYRSKHVESTGVIQSLVDTYVANIGTDFEFIKGITYDKQSPTVWNKAKNYLKNL